ncbi:TPA: hypothetical protein N0F65_008399 [Lagenidium giganteum]|uniref:Uncharacterized protein n=1 Tax=Lagenidium giganteum TaxID=4803 RepID=A0AAV2Z0I0_9STRA|nr:TPA: hypothetical protein N0F65_008399 [Lagenidium giganteum]
MNVAVDSPSPAERDADGCEAALTPRLSCTCRDRQVDCTPSCRRKDLKVHFENAAHSPTREDEHVHLRQLQRKFSNHAAASTGFDDTFLDDIMTTAPTLAQVPVRQSVRRSQSCGAHAVAQSMQSHHCNMYRIKIGYQDEKLRERCQQNTHKLLQTARDTSDASSTSAILAKKALKYRKVLERMEGIDINDPALDVSACLGVTWHRVTSE